MFKRITLAEISAQGTTAIYNNLKNDAFTPDALADIIVEKPQLFFEDVKFSEVMKVVQDYRSENFTPSFNTKEIRVKRSNNKAFLYNDGTPVPKGVRIGVDHLGEVRYDKGIIVTGEVQK